MSLKINNPRISHCADWGLLVEFGERIDPELNAWTRLVADRLRQCLTDSVLEVVTAYSSFLVIYDPALLDTEALRKTVLACCSEKKEDEAFQLSSTAEIPVCYEPEYAPDIEDVARFNNLTVEEVIDIHSGTEYLIYMLGFAPGFPYLGGLDQRLHTPRLDTPRKLLPAGAVGIAGSQTGIYPLASPGGWRIIGRTPLQLFDAGKKPPVPYYAPGDKLKFKRISSREFQRMAGEQSHGK
ncbi:MAG: 5-oxoprolinase subunit PxpB [Desulfobacteraceae bacterium]|nr:5-oxoprolinase subunit PxpB [Desulfobacteraceae bacterium]